MTAGPEELSGQHGGGEIQDGSDGASDPFAGGGKWTRRGEWLEAMPGRVITAAADKQAAIDAWLLGVAGMPAKLHARLRRGWHPVAGRPAAAGPVPSPGSRNRAGMAGGCG